MIPIPRTKDHGTDLGLSDTSVAVSDRDSIPDPLPPTHLPEICSLSLTHNLHDRGSASPSRLLPLYIMQNILRKQRVNIRWSRMKQPVDLVCDHGFQTRELVRDFLSKYQLVIWMSMSNASILMMMLSAISMLHALYKRRF